MVTSDDGSRTEWLEILWRDSTPLLTS